VVTFNLLKNRKIRLEDEARSEIDGGVEMNWRIFVGFSKMKAKLGMKQE
jgi:hypothetical protein